MSANPSSSSRNYNAANIANVPMNQNNFNNLRNIEKISDEDEDRKFNVAPNSNTSTVSSNVANITNIPTNQQNQNDTAKQAKVSQEPAQAQFQGKTQPQLQTQPQNQVQSNQRTDRGKRTPSVQINPVKLRMLRRFMELVKEPFEAFRMGDAPVIDTMIRCADVNVEKLRKCLIEGFAKPAYLPAEDEVFELYPSQPQSEAKTTDTNDIQNSNQSENDRNNRRPRNFQVALSFATYRFLTGIQNELAQDMTWQPDINAVANAVLDTGKHYRRQVVLGIAQSFEDLQNKP